MNRRENIEKMTNEFGGVFRTTDLNALGYNTYAIRKLIDGKIIERIKPSYYRIFKSDEGLSEAAQVAQLFPDAVLCMYTALFFYNYLDIAPPEWTIAVDRDTSKSRFKLNFPYVHPYYMKKDFLFLGVITVDCGDCTMKIFDRDRLICECIFFESKMRKDVYNKAIKAYVLDSNKNIVNLLKYAKKRRIIKKVEDRIGVWL